MRIERLVVGELATNCYLAWDEKTGEGVVIDPGDEGTYIVDKIQQLSFKPKLIVATHGHFDHLMGVLEVKMAFGVPFLVHEKDAELVKKAAQSGEYWLGHKMDPIPLADEYLGKEVKFGDEVLQVIETPGHTPGGVSLYAKGECKSALKSNEIATSSRHSSSLLAMTEEKNKGVVFTGDTLFADGGVGRTDFKYSDEELLQESVKKLLELPEETVIWPGHGEESTVGEEREWNNLE